MKQFPHTILDLITTVDEVTLDNADGVYRKTETPWGYVQILAKGNMLGLGLIAGLRAELSANMVDVEKLPCAPGVDVDVYSYIFDTLPHLRRKYLLDNPEKIT